MENCVRFWCVKHIKGVKSLLHNVLFMLFRQKTGLNGKCTKNSKYMLVILESFGTKF
jgi:hypothetical protein